MAETKTPAATGPRKVVITCAVTGAIHTPTMSPHLPITPDEIVADAFRPLARDGAAQGEVPVRLQKCLASLAATAPAHADVFRDAARAALARSRRALDREDARVLKAAMSAAWTTV